MGDGSAWPRISVITPSFNQANYLEATLRSVLLQGYPNLEYFVMDGGSNDGSVDIIRKYAPWITQWVSERDGGQSAAISRGLHLSTGSFTTWINSDDMLDRNALTSQATQFGFHPGTVYVGDCTYIDDQARRLSLHRGRIHDFDDLVSIRMVWRDRDRRGHIVQPEVLFPRQLTLDVGGPNLSNHHTMDYELWGKFLLAGAAFQYTHIPFGMFRLHGEQKTGQTWATTQSLTAAAIRLVALADHLSDAHRRSIVADLRAYEREYWLATGPLARMGLPPDLVLRLRALRTRVRQQIDKRIHRATFQPVGAK
jgi:glycosyltransferase involved in cell wall biosynthesis